MVRIQRSVGHNLSLYIGIEVCEPFQDTQFNVYKLEIPHECHYIKILLVQYSSQQDNQFLSMNETTVVQVHRQLRTLRHVIPHLQQAHL